MYTQKSVRLFIFLPYFRDEMQCYATKMYVCIGTICMYMLSSMLLSSVPKKFNLGPLFRV